MEDTIKYVRLRIDNTAGEFPYPNKVLICIIKNTDTDKIYTENECSHDLEIDPIKVFKLAVYIE